MTTTASQYKHLIKLYAKAFYEKCPESIVQDAKHKDPEQAAKDCKGLVCVVVDELTKHEWLPEEKLAEYLNLSGTETRQVLHFLTTQHMVTKSSLKTTRQEAFNHFGLQDSVKNIKRDQDKLDREEFMKKKLQYEFCCIDFPKAIDAIRLRIHKVDKALKDIVHDDNDIQQYVCPSCGQVYSAFDAMTLFDPGTRAFLCDVCRTEVDQTFGMNASGDDAQRREQKMQAKLQQDKMDAQLMPIVQLLKSLTNKPPPDPGTLRDYVLSKRINQNFGTGMGGGGGGNQVQIQMSQGSGGGGDGGLNNYGTEYQPPWLAAANQQGGSKQSGGSTRQQGGLSSLDARDESRKHKASDRSIDDVKVKKLKEDEEFGVDVVIKRDDVKEEVWGDDKDDGNVEWEDI